MNEVLCPASGACAPLPCPLHSPARFPPQPACFPPALPPTCSWLNDSRSECRAVQAPSERGRRVRALLLKSSHCSVPPKTLPKSLGRAARPLL